MVTHILVDVKYLRNPNLISIESNASILEAIRTMVSRTDRNITQNDLLIKINSIFLARAAL